MALRRSLAVRVFAVILLAWAGIDLAAPQLCAADRGDIVASTHLDASSAHQGIASPEAQTPGNPGDCFCCAQNIMPARVLPILSEAAIISPLFPDVIEQVQSVPRALYRPPQLSL